MNHFQYIFDHPARNHNNIVRYAGKFLLKPETNAVHIKDCISIGLMLYRIIRDECPEFEIDKKDLVYRLAIHDDDEPMIDLPRPYKYHNEQILNAVKFTNREIMKEFYTDEEISEIEHSKDYDTFEGFLAEIADKIQSSMKIYEEFVILKNGYFKKDMKLVSNTLTKLIRQDMSNLKVIIPFQVENVLRRIVMDITQALQYHIDGSGN